MKNDKLLLTILIANGVLSAISLLGGHHTAAAIYNLATLLFLGVVFTPFGD